MKLIATIFAAISMLFNGDVKSNEPPVVPMNTAIITYAETYYAPTVADPDNFPYAKAVKLTAIVEEPKKEIKPVIPAPITQSTPIPTPPSASPPPPTSAEDQYLVTTEPILSWLRMDFAFGGDGFETPQPREFSAIKIDREYWKIEVFAYWAVGITPPKPPVENDYFKLEVYDKKTDKLVYTMTSGKEESFHKYQIFKKPGDYYFKAYSKPVMKYEINLFVSPKMAQ